VALYRIHMLTGRAEGEVVRWSTTGSLFVVQCHSNLEFFSTVCGSWLFATRSLCAVLQDLVLLHTITHPSRIHDVKFIRHPTTEDQLLLVAAEDKKLSVYVIPSDETERPRVIAEMIGHSNRLVAWIPLTVDDRAHYVLCQGESC
jgi:protein MAK11